MKNTDIATVPGTLVRDGHRRTVLSIVGKDRMVPVQSSGTRFYMKGSFGWRTVANRIAAGDFDPASLAQHVSYEGGVAPMINVAQCDDTVSRRVYMAMVGGAAHEAFHRCYSQQGNLSEEAIRRAIAPVRANPTVQWAKHRKLVLDLQNVFEDVAIERIGCAEFPGVAVKMADLADFIVKMERDSRAAAGVPVTAVSAVFITLRDAGLGYNTDYVRANLADIKRECPEGFAMVAKGGALHDILLRSIPDVSSPAAIARAKQSLIDGSALTLALEAVAILSKVASGEDKGEGKGEGKGDKSAKGEGKGDKGEPAKGEGQGEGSEPCEGEGKGDKSAKGEPSKGEPSKGEPSKGEPSKGEPSKGEPGEGESGEGESGEGEPGEGEPGEGEPGEGLNTDASDEGTGAGGGVGNSKVTAGDVLSQHAATGKGTLDSNSALEAGIREERAKEPATNETAPWRPYSTTQDEIVRVKAQTSRAGSFTHLANEVRASTVYLRTRLAVLFRALEEAGVEHGVRKGPALSGRMLVNSHCEMVGGSMPTRAYMERTPAVDMSIAAVLVIDESSSMRDKLRETTQVAYTLMDALDSIGAKSMAVGFRSGRHPNSYLSSSEVNGYHRTHGMYYDLFKDWSETFKSAAPRLAEIRATGGTPMSDGIEFALRELSTRPEGHRVIFVLTDGQPDSGHSAVIRGQLQRAAEAGILVVGVGLGYGSEYVQHAFPEAVYAPDIAALPKLLVAKLETLVRTRHALAKRGKAVRAA
jgi:hypothetical protein